MSRTQVRVDLGRMLKHLSESMNHEAKHVHLILAGRWKQVHGEKVFCQPLAHTTKRGMNIAKWFERAFKLYDDKGMRSGPMFRTNKGKRACIGDLDVNFLALFREVQTKYPNLIGDVENLSDYSMRRSGPRGATV